ncbi:MAG: glycoside hydrolase family 32 protein [Gemmataceae bacterium]
MRGCLLGLLLAGVCLAADRPEVVLADFEGATYGDWITKGTAFGTGPARGTLPGQMPVGGFKGKGLVNSFLGGDRAVGSLTSPEFRIDRRFLTFLIGGGGHAGQTCMNLLVEGKVVRTATGSNTEAGGSEELEPAGWDVGDLAGKKARLEIVDAATGGWGHINVDHIVLTDQKPVALARSVEREIRLEKRFLEFPVKTGAPKRRLSVLLDGKPWREFDIELTDQKPDLRAVLDVGTLRNRSVTLRAGKVSEKLLEVVQQVDAPTDEATIYQERARPQFHFTSRRGWLNDPNGLVYHRGEWHLFYQHNPYGWNWGNMHWGHAVSRDLFHWKEQPTALYPRSYGDWAFSGSAFVDRFDTLGERRGDEECLVLAYTSTGRGECLAFSRDRGRTWQELKENPVVRHAGRDPKVIWHAGTKRWIMAVYDEHAGKQWIAFHSSADLRTWTLESRIVGFYECPDLFEIAVTGKPDERRWVLYGADGQYVVGSFDGKTFRPEGGKQRVWWGNFYAAQTFSDAPDGRRVQIGWGQGITFPGTPFNQQMTVPCELTLRPGPERPRLHVEPVREIAGLHGKKRQWKDQALEPGKNLLAGVQGELFDLALDVAPDRAERIVLRVRGESVVYDARKETLVCKAGTIPLKLDAGRLRLRILVDRGSIELFGNDGAVAVSLGAPLWERPRTLELTAEGGNARVRSLDLIELRSAWTK